jgi:hypothetical protein
MLGTEATVPDQEPVVRESDVGRGKVLSPGRRVARSWSMGQGFLRSACRFLALGLLLLLSACGGTGLDAGGESETNNGGIAFVAMAGMLIVIALVLWWIIGREDR